MWNMGHFKANPAFKLRIKIRWNEKKDELLKEVKIRKKEEMNERGSNRMMVSG